MSRGVVGRGGLGFGSEERNIEEYMSVSGKRLLTNTAHGCGMEDYIDLYRFLFANR